MITLQDPAQEERVLEISEDWERSGVSPRLVLLIGGKDYSERIISGEWGQAEGPAISATINLSGNLPARLENAPVRLVVDIGGIQVPQLTGHRSRAEQGQERTSTSLVAASLGSLLGKVTFDLTPDVNGRRLLEFRGVSPERIVWSTLARLPYDLSRVSVEPVGTPILTFAGSDGGFKAEQHPTDVLGRVFESVAYQLSDTPYGGCEAKLAPDLANPGELVTIYDADEITWTPPSLIDELYTQVMVFRYNPDGSDAFPPVVVDVPYVGLEHELVRGQTLPIPFADESANAAAFAAQHGRNTAFNLARGYRKGETALPFAPLMRKGDAFGVREVREDDDGTWERMWVCMTDSYKHPITENHLETTVGYTASLVRKRLIRIPRIVISGVGSGVILTPRPVETRVRVSFPAPGYDVLKGNQEFRVLVRKKGIGDDPTCEIRLLENATLISTVLTSTPVSSVAVLSAIWDPSTLSDPTGAGVECEVVGGAEQGVALEVGAIEWNAAL